MVEEAEARSAAIDPGPCEIDTTGLDRLLGPDPDRSQDTRLFTYRYCSWRSPTGEFQVRYNVEPSTADGIFADPGARALELGQDLEAVSIRSSVALEGSNGYSVLVRDQRFAAYFQYASERPVTDDERAAVERIAAAAAAELYG